MTIPAAQLSQVSYPSCVVNLHIMFEERLQIRVPSGGSGDTQQFTTEDLVSEHNSGVFVMNRVPQKCTINRSGHVTAATFKMVFDYRELPIDPRTIVACAVEIHFGTVGADDFSDGIQREVSPGVRRSILRTRRADGTTIDDSLAMVGIVDEWTADQSDSNSEVHLEGRDLRGMFLDSPLVTPRDQRAHNGHKGQPGHTPPTAPTGGHGARVPRPSGILDRLRCDVPIDDLVRQILKEHDAIAKLPETLRPQVICNAAEWPDGEIPSPGAGSHVPRHRRGAAGHGSASGGGHENLNFWDIITRYCQLVGGVPTFVGRNLYIRPGNNLWRLLRDNSITPFRSEGERNTMRADPPSMATPWSIRRLVYGRDVKSMKITRKYGGHSKPKTILCVAPNLSAKQRGHAAERMLEVAWPPRNVREARREFVTSNPRSVVGGQESQEMVRIPCHGVKNVTQLIQIAQSMYEQIGRNEMRGDIEAAGITSFGGNNADPDLLRLQVGDPIEVMVDASTLDTTSPIVSVLNRTTQLPFQEAVNEVRRYLRDVNLARAIVATARGNIMGVLRYFYVSGVDLDWSNEAVTVKADIQNYWTPRWDFKESDLRREAAAAAAHDRQRAGTSGSANQRAPGRPHTAPSTQAARSQAPQTTTRQAPSGATSLHGSPTSDFQFPTGADISDAATRSRWAR